MAYFSNTSTPSYIDPSQEKERREAILRERQLEEKSRGLLDIGKHCSQSMCGQTDFLPLTCDKCSRVFCVDHHRYEAHNCDFSYETQNVMPKCPICNKYVRVPLNGTPDIIMERHIESGCTSNLLDNKEDRMRIKEELRCSASTCGNPNKYSTIKCPKCRKQFCLSHRFPTDHACEQLVSKSTPTRSSPSKNTESPIDSSEQKNPEEGEQPSLIDRIRNAISRRMNSSPSSTPSSSSTATTKTTSGLSKSQEARARLEAARQAREQQGGKTHATAVRKNPVVKVSNSSVVDAPEQVSLESFQEGVPDSSSGQTFIAPPKQRRTKATGLDLSRLKRAAEPAQAPSETDYDLELSKRIHFQVVFPSKDATNSPLPLSLRNQDPQKLYFNRKISIGKAIDLICTKYGIPNYNSDPRKPKITLCRIDEPHLALPYSVTFENLSENGIDIQEGDTLGFVWVLNS